MTQTMSIEAIRRLQSRPPVDVEALAEHLGVKVWQSSLPENVSCKIFADPNHGGSSGYSIIANANDPPVRKRFTIAHALAHCILHMDRIGSGIEEDASYRNERLTGREETEATLLAADILMPLHLIHRFGTASATAESLARIFQVSTEAMQIRLNASHGRSRQAVLNAWKAFDASSALPFTETGAIDIGREEFSLKTAIDGKRW